MGIEQTYAKEDILYVRYEDLKDPKKRIKVRCAHLLTHSLTHSLTIRR